ncbi:MAG: glycosyltransferase family 39 protein [Acidobacteriota bacterium]
MDRRVSVFGVGLATVSVHLGLAAVARLAGPRVLWGDEKAYLSSAVAVLQGDPSWWPVPLWPPLYPRFLAGILAVSGVNPVGITVVQTILLFIAAVIFGDLVRRWTGARSAGMAAFLMMAGFPSLAAFSRFLWPEVLHLVLLVAAVWILVVRRDSHLWLALAGISLGLALLTKSLLGPFLPVLLGAAFIGDRGPRRILRLTICVAAIVVVIGPVIGLQYRRVGVPVIADSSAFNLWVGLNDRGMKSFEEPIVTKAYREYWAWDGTFAERNARAHRQSLQLIRERGMGTVLKAQFGRQYARLFDKDSYLTEQVPGGAAVEQGSGFVALGPRVSEGVRRVSYGTYALLLMTAPLGFLVWPFAERRWPRVLLLFLLYNLALFLVLHVKSRYRIQLMPVFFLGSSAAIAWFEAGFEGRISLRPVVGRLGVAGVVSAVLLWLAF